MGHGLEKHDGMAYVKRTQADVPWHGLGNPVQPGVSIEKMAIEAKLEWGVGLTPVLFQAHGKTWRDNRHNVMYREDSNMVLDIVGPNYVPVQNAEVLEFFREYVETGDMDMETAGSLQNGKIVWALAKMNQNFFLNGDDEVRGYVLLMNPHQYGKGMVVKFTPIRVVCYNTLTMALHSGGGLKLWHNQKFDTAAQREAKIRLGLAREKLDVFREDAEKLVNAVLDEAVAINLLNEVFGSDNLDKPVEEQTPTVQRVMALYGGLGYGATLPTAQSTAWGLLNATTQYFDHEYGRSADNRLTNAWMGGGEVKKRKMFEALLELVG